MAQTRLHGFDQALFHNRGTCYYQCEYVKGQSALWKDVRTYDAAVEKAQEFRNYRAMTNRAGSRNAQNVPQDQNYRAETGPLGNDAVYSCMFYFATGMAPPRGSDDANHEIVFVTNHAGTTVCYYEPNFGFYTADSVGVGGGALNNLQILEHYIAQHYAGIGQVYNFKYKRVRVLPGA